MIFFVNKWNVQDLNEDETPEIIINYVIASSTSHAECIIWPTIYKWDGLKYIETSKDFPEYYKGIVEETNNRLAELSKIDLEEKAKSDKRSKEQLAKWRQLHMADIEVLLFKAKQMIGEKRAGFDRAVSWCLNEDPKLRRNAVTIFAGIMDVKSQEYLRQMTKDQDPIVSQMAIDALKSK